MAWRAEFATLADYVEKVLQLHIWSIRRDTHDFAFEYGVFCN